MGQLRELLELPVIVNLFVEKLSERRSDFLSSLRDTFYLENKLLQVLDYKS